MADAAAQPALRGLSKSERRGGWMLGRLCRDRPARRASDLAELARAAIAPAGFAWRRPRRTLRGRQDAAAASASRERLANLKSRAAAGAIDLVFLDGSGALAHPYPARCRARRPLRIKAPGQTKKRAMPGTVAV